MKAMKRGRCCCSCCIALFDEDFKLREERVCVGGEGMGVIHGNAVPILKKKNGKR